MRRWWILVAAGALVALPACGGDDNGAAPRADPGTKGSSTSAPDSAAGGAGGTDLDICALVDIATVEAVLGEPAEPGVDGSTGDLRSCQWQGTGDALNSLSVSVYVHPDAASARSQYEATKEGLAGSEITGLGDAASYNESFGLEVLSGRYDISVDNTGPDEQQSDIRVAQLLIGSLAG